MNRRMCVAHVVALVVIGVCGLAVPALAQDCPELVGRMPGIGSIVAVALSGDYAYALSSDRPNSPFPAEAVLRVIDVGTPSHPTEVGSVSTPGYGIDVATSEGYAYVVGDEGLSVIDVRTPSAPVEVAFVETSGDTWVAGVAVSGSYAYVAWGNDYEGGGGLQIIDVSTPSTPVDVGSVETPFSCSDVAVSGTNAYVTYEDNDYSGGPSEAGLLVIDVSTPSAPVEVGSYAREEGGCWWDADGVAISGDYAYVVQRCVGDVGGSAFFLVIDVSTPSAPVEVGSVESYSTGVAVSGNFAYLAGGDGLRVIDVSTPSEPIEVGSLQGMYDAADVAVSDGRAYVAAGESGLRVVDVSTPSAPIEVGLGFVGWPARGTMAVSGGYAYIAGTPRGLTVIDVSTPSAPAVVGFLGVGGTNVAVAGDYAYVAGWDGFWVIDVSTPSAPVEVGSMVGTPYGSGVDVAVSGGHAYVAYSNQGPPGHGLRIIDVTTPSAPVEVGFIALQGPSSVDFVGGVAVEGGYAYVTLNSCEPGICRGSLRVIDVRTPSAPVEVGTVDTPNEARGVAVSGGYAYVAGWSSGLRVIDVSMPSVPVEVGYAPAHPAVDVAVSGGYAYVVRRYPYPDYRRYLQVIDVSVPSAPVDVSFFQTLDARYNTSIAVSDGYVYFAAGSAGLYIFRDCAEHGPEKMPHPYPSSVD